MSSPIVAANAIIQNEGGTISGVYITDLTVKQAVTTQVLQLGANVTMNESVVTGLIYNNINQVTNSFISSVGEDGIQSAAWSANGGPPQWKGGILNFVGGTTQVSIGLEGGVILRGGGVFEDVTAQANDVYIILGTSLDLFGTSSANTYPGQANAFIWGAGALDVANGSSLLINHTTAAPVLLNTTTELDGVTTGCSTSNIAASVTNCNIAISGTTIDAAFGTAGGGGMLWSPAGSSIITLNAPF